MQIAKVVPIYKASDNNLLNNYRPISLLTSFSKLLEKIMYDKVISFQMMFFTNINMDLDPNIRLFITLCISIIIVHHLQTNKTANIHWQSSVTIRRDQPSYFTPQTE